MSEQGRREGRGATGYKEGKQMREERREGREEGKNKEKDGESGLYIISECHQLIQTQNINILKKNNNKIK